MDLFDDFDDDFDDQPLTDQRRQRILGWLALAAIVILVGFATWVCTKL